MQAGRGLVGAEHVDVVCWKGGAWWKGRGSGVSVCLSAGCGRTGVICAAELVRDLLVQRVSAHVRV